MRKNMFQLPEEILAWIKNPEATPKPSFSSNYFFIDKAYFHGLQISKLHKKVLELQSKELLTKDFMCFSIENRHYICKVFNNTDAVVEQIQESIEQSKCYCSVGNGYRTNEFFKTESEEDNFQKLSNLEKINFYISHVTKRDEVKDILKKYYGIA